MNLEPSIRNGRILNLNDILVSLKKCTDADYLTDYIDEIESYVSDYPDAVSQDDINTLKSALKERLKTLKVPPLIGYYEFADLYKKLLEKTQTKEEEASIQRYIAKCLKLLEKEQISFDEQNALDLYMNDYLANKLKTKSEENLFKRYNDIIKINKSRMLEKNPGKKPLRIKPINTNGRIIAITLIEVTILVGILLGVLAIAK
ncbi:unknown [Clostridium sp. CAG:533]|nr:unknown [Clostridium sp. CAG:533]